MPFEMQKVKRVVGSTGFRFFEPVTIRNGDFTNGNQHNQTLQASQMGVIGELQIGFDSPVDRALALFLGDVFDETLRGQGQTHAGSLDVDLETAADGEATAGAKAGFGFVTRQDKPSDNAFPVRDEARIDDAVTPREEQPKFWANKRPLVAGLEGEFLVFVAVAPPGTTESYGMDHSGVEIEAQMLTSEGYNSWQNRGGSRGRA